MFRMILFICLCICLEAAANMPLSKNDYENFKKSLRLTPVQARLIGEIELQTENNNKILREKYNKAHREYIEVGRNCKENTCYKRLPELQEEMKDLNKRMYNNIQKQNEMIIELLFPWQKDRYKEYHSRVY